MSAMKTVLFEQQGQIGILTIDSPPVNALTMQVLGELEGIITAIYANSCKDLRALVLTGAGEKFFMAGADISNFTNLTPESGIAFVKQHTDIFDRIAALPLPVICAVNGTALGAGLELALACDIRILSEKAKVGLPETGLGIYPGAGGTQRLARLVGAGNAKRMIFSAAHVTALEAHSMGICEELAPPEAVLPQALELAASIAANGPVAVAAAKRLIDEGLDCSIAEGMALENRAFGSLCDTWDKNEGACAFLEKRKPQFQGK